jgi:hypothetical protein
VRGSLSLAVALAALLAASQAIAAAPTPTLGRTVVVSPAGGVVTVTPKKARRATRLRTATVLPVGSTVDATRGKVKLTSARNSRGTLQTGVFNGAPFVVTQDRTGLTDLKLTGGDFSACATAIGSVHAAATPRRRLAGRAHGRFRTRGRNSSATVRGTSWVTTDACDGTSTLSQSGKVATKSLGQSFDLDPGEEITYFCNKFFVAPDTYCVFLLRAPAMGLWATGLLAITNETQYDLCVDGPGGEQRCTTYPLSAPDRVNFRTGIAACYVDRGPGTYVFHWRLAGMELFPPLDFTTPVAGLNAPCQHKP